MASKASTVKWRRAKGVRPHSEATDKSGPTVCISCGQRFNRHKTHKFYERNDGKHYVYVDDEGRRINGNKCYQCSLDYLRTYQRKNGHLPRELVREHSNRIGYVSETKVIQRLTEIGLSAKFGPHKGVDLIVEDSVSIEVKTASKNDLMIRVQNKNFYLNDYLAVVFPDDRIFIVDASEVEFMRGKSSTMSCRSMLPEYEYKRGPRTHAFKTALDIKKFGEMLCETLQKYRSN